MKDSLEEENKSERRVLVIQLVHGTQMGGRVTRWAVQCSECGMSDEILTSKLKGLRARRAHAYEVHGLR